MARKVIPRHKYARLQLEKQYIAKFKTFSRTEMSSQGKAKNRCSTALCPSRRYQNDVQTNFQMIFMVEILLFFLLYSSVFSAGTFHATLNALPKISNFLNSI